MIQIADTDPVRTITLGRPQLRNALGLARREPRFKGR